jgi:hypothetical protein
VRERERERETERETERECALYPTTHPPPHNRTTTHLAQRQWVLALELLELLEGLALLHHTDGVVLALRLELGQLGGLGSLLLGDEVERVLHLLLRGRLLVRGFLRLGSCRRGLIRGGLGSLGVLGSGGGCLLGLLLRRGGGVSAGGRLLRGGFGSGLRLGSGGSLALGLLLSGARVVGLGLRQVGCGLSGVRGGGGLQSKQQTTQPHTDRHRHRIQIHTQRSERVRADRHRQRSERRKPGQGRQTQAQNTIQYAAERPLTNDIHSHFHQPPS